ncbi:metallophosphoesterase [Pseudoroseicyclus aestuarii]|uniref:Calcineurin-like phosphoesterase family protein n=1 Tax=Pseudoroseicyclus aestuarii TaxID=1795041 RepID=A0A318T3R7_9RHOB|nr:metallophosphoesterase [Pseudoroseicyclus aestuarii]PYE84884.1 calcineurin-like phosphoesterase family protein [Pseudoroseicyclus aestuarii]
MRVLHLTDLHLSAGDDPGLDADTGASMDRALEAMRRIDPAPDFAVLSGDLTNRGDEGSYALLAERLEGIGVPLILALGNHDKRPAFRAVFTGYPGGGEDPLDYDMVLAGHHVITLDTSEPGRTGGTLEDAQLEGLEATLARHPELPKLLVLHHMPKLDPRRPADWTSLDAATSDRLAALLAPHEVTAILSGHVHANRVALWHGIPVVITMGQHATIDPLEREALRIVPGTGLALCDLLPHGLSVTYIPLHPAETMRLIPRERLQALR